MAGLHLQQLREARAVTRHELAAAAGVGIVTIWRVEASRVRPSARVRRKLAATLRLDVDSIAWPERSGSSDKRRA